MIYTIEVKDDTGAVVKSAIVNLDNKNIKGWKDYVQLQFGWTDADVALLYSAPEYCPYDCDGCRS